MMNNVVTNNLTPRVVLVNPPADYDRETYKKFDISMASGIPFGLLLLATVLKCEGFSVRLIDGQVCDYLAEVERELQAPGILCVGISVMTSQLENASQLSLLVKEKNPTMPVVWGGFHPSILPDEVIALPFVDYVVMGEADVALPELCRYLRGRGELSDVGNLIYNMGDGVRKNKMLPLSGFESLPDLDWEILDDLECYIKKKNVIGEPTRMLSLLAGLGCNFACAFCHNAIYKKRHRTNPALRLVSEMNRLHERYEVTEFGLADENFFGDKERLLDFLALLEHNQYRFLWSSTLRASYASENYLNRSMLARISQAGGYYFGVGAESGSDFVLKKLHKGITPSHVLTLAAWTRDIPMTLTYSFIAGIPGETCRMTLETFRLIEEIKRINPNSLIIGPQVFRPYPGSPLTAEVMEALRQRYPDGHPENIMRKMLSRFRKIDEEAIPWHAEPFRFKYMLLSFYVLQLKKNKGPLLNAIVTFAQILSRLRLNTGWYSYFFEKPMLAALNKRLT